MWKSINNHSYYVKMWIIHFTVLNIQSIHGYFSLCFFEGNVSSACSPPYGIALLSRTWPLFPANVCLSPSSANCELHIMDNLLLSVSDPWSL